MTALCARCGHVLVDRDEEGWYYQIPVTSEEAPGLIFMDRVHQCGGKPHLVIAPEITSPRCEFCGNEESHPFHAPDYEFSGRHAFQAPAPACRTCNDTGIVRCAETNPEDGIYEQACPEPIHRDRTAVIPDEDVTFPVDPTPATPLSDWNW